MAASTLAFRIDHMVFTHHTYQLDLHTYPCPFHLLIRTFAVSIVVIIKAFRVLLSLPIHEQMNIYLHMDMFYL